MWFTRNKNGRGGRINFDKIETAHLDELMEFMKKLTSGQREASRNIMATGGGSFKFYDHMKERLGVEVNRADEMECLIKGLDFFITRVPEEVFCYSEQNPMWFPERPTKYPCLLVNIGSGVSMLKVEGPGKFTRIGGSSLGGGTLWGLLSLLTDAKSYDDMLAMAAQGDNRNVDMLVGDIYGDGVGIPRIGLKSTTIASSFGKVFKKATREHDPSVRQKMFRGEDISRSLLYTVSNNIGQIAYLQAQRHNLGHIYFSGSYIRGHPQTMNTLSYAINFWSQGEKTAYFLRHEAYLGAVGAFLQELPPEWMNTELNGTAST